MKHLSNYSQFEAYPTLRWIDGSSSDQQYFNFLESIIINEGLMDNAKQFFSWLKEKILDTLWIIAERSVKIGFSILEKAKMLCKWILEKIKSFKQKYPVLYKVIIMTILVILLVIVSGSVAYSQTKGEPVPAPLIDLTIGLLDDLRSELQNYNSVEINKAIAYLIDLKAKKGIVDPNAVQQFGDVSVNLAQKAMKSSEKLAQQARDGNETSYRYCMKLMSEGEKFIQFKIIKTETTELVQLGLKK